MNSENLNVKKLYYSIGEVSKITGLKPYVLRFWETEFKQLNPAKNRAGNRTYRQKDIDFILKIQSLLYDHKFTIKGAKSQLSKLNDLEIDSSQTMGDQDYNPSRLLINIRKELKSIISIINE